MKRSDLRVQLGRAAARAMRGDPSRSEELWLKAYKQAVLEGDVGEANAALAFASRAARAQLKFAEARQYLDTAISREPESRSLAAGLAGLLQDWASAEPESSTRHSLLEEALSIRESLGRSGDDAEVHREIAIRIKDLLR